MSALCPIANMQEFATRIRLNPDYGTADCWLYNIAQGIRRNRVSWRSVMHNHTERSREYFRQAEECARQANAQMDPKVKRQFLVLAQLWLILAELFELKSEPTYRASPKPQSTSREA